MSGVSVDAVERTMRALLESDVRPILYHDTPTGELIEVSPQLAASPAGLLPTIIVAGEAVWRELTGQGFSLDVRRHPDALLGYQLSGIGAGNFTTVMLAAMEATAQATQPHALICNELNAVWLAATARIGQDIAASERHAPTASP